MYLLIIRYAHRERLKAYSVPYLLRQTIH
jgi:hypothetical protein